MQSHFRQQVLSKIAVLSDEQVATLDQYIDFMQFRMQNKESVDQYLDDFNNNRNQMKAE